MTEATAANRAELPGGASSAMAVTTNADAAIEAALTEAIALATVGDWSGAERVVHGYLRALPADELPGAYIGFVDLVPGLLATAPPTLTIPRSAALVAEPAAVSARRPGLLPFPDPALDYAHAVLTALRGRLAGRQPTAARQVS